MPTGCYDHSYRKKTLSQYENEAHWEGECFIHPAKMGNQLSRKVYQIRHEKLVDYLFVCHSCDNSHCINDNHHFLGTQKDNMKDASQKGHLICPLSRRLKISASNSLAHKGKPLSFKHRQAIAIGNCGHIVTEKTRQKISVSQIGKKLSGEHRLKLSISHRGHWLTIKQRKKISISLKKYWKGKHNG